ncbi:hypothetical protein [Christiangramia sp. SM2212]|uniref:Uncharacterized protein n=1 Tax=Christiangramia sediminicola TaxID=3073267 RepID=A0ABU1EM74_9FLAO|nr:hypothetical protein [Christiangramia sp. SM2212]MDR5589089.1 hypothetical protein [Christiangramia sp. SM2212]
MLLLLSIAGVVSFQFGLYFLLPVSFWILISVLAPFFDMPGLINSGKMKYQSSLMISEKEKNKQIVIHGGTLFDYYFVLDKEHSPKQRKNFILLEYLNGLLNLIDSRQDDLELKIKGTTYILNERTAEKIGFEIQETDTVQQIILIMNYPNLLVTKSFAMKKISFPRLNKTSTYLADIADLKKNRNKIEQIRNILKNKIEAF